MKEPRKQMRCTECGGRAIRKVGDYEAYGIVRHGVPYYECTQCGETFIDMEELRIFESMALMQKKAAATA